MLRRLLRLCAALVCLLAARSASAAIAIDVNASADRNVAGTTVTSPAFSTTGQNELLLAFVETDGPLGAQTSITSVSGGGLTWSLVVRANLQPGTAEIWRAFAGVPLANVSVTATISQSVVSSLTIMSFTGADPTGVNGAGAIGATASASAPAGAPAATLVTTRNNSWVFAAGNDWDNPIARTLGASQTLIHQSLSATGDTYWVQRQSAVTPVAGTAVTINDTAPISDKYNLSLVEILQADPTATPPPAPPPPPPPPPPATFSLGGTVTPSVNGSGATMNLTGAAAASTIVDVNGNYSFAGIANGSYIVTPSKTGFTFTPATQSITINGANATAIDFTAQAPAPPPPPPPLPPSPTGVRLIQKNVSGNEASVPSISAAFPASNTAGNFLIVSGTAARPAGTMSISDTAGNTYLPAIGPVTDPVQDVTAYIWYVPNCKGGPNTVTLTPDAARALEIHISEWTGLSTLSPVDKTASAAASGTNVTVGPVVTTTAGELVFAYSFVFNVGSAGTGFTPLSLVNGDLDEYLIQSTAGNVTATFTQTAGAWFTLMATFKPAGSVAPPPVTTTPTVAITAPAPGASVAGSVTVTANASDASGIAGVQFRLDGVNLGAEVLAAPYSIAWNTTTALDGTHTLTAVARNTSGVTASSAPVTVSVGNNVGLASTGQWGQPFDLGIVAVNAVMLHTGKVLMYAGSFASSYVERVWDPATGAITLVANPFSNLFCSGEAQLADGRVLVVGGFDSASLGAANASIFDPVTESWSAAPNMAFRRWYPTATALPDGRMLVTSGGQTCLTCLADLPEIFDPSTGRFSTLTSARLSVPYYPFMFVLPDGTVVDAGANEQPVTTSRLNLTSGTWSTVDPIVRDGHSAVMYRPGQILKSGTAADSGTAGVAAATAYVIDMTQPTPSWRQVTSMAKPRAFHNSTVLPNGTVLVTGGGTALDGHDVTKAVFAAELWSPATETWQTLASASVPRLYHSTALLLPDGRVLSAGSGNDTGAIDQTQGQIFSPPYLFKGARPTITSAPGVISYGGTFSVQTPDAASIASVSLIKPGSVTHAFDEDQRFVPLTFAAGAGALTIQAPANANLAPPGYYMLFLVNTNGVPSIASFVRLPTGVVDNIPPTAPASLVAQGALGSATLSWSASTDNTGVAVYNVHRSATSGFVPSASNRIGQSTSTSFTDAGVVAGTYFYVVTAQDVAGNVSVPSNEAAAIVLADTTPPTVAITSPADQAPVSGSITISATAIDDVGVAGVQFLIDGAPLGPERTSPPYSIAWNTATTSNGAHTVSAVARDAAGNQAQASVTVSVLNAAPVISGLVAAYGFNEGAGVLTFDSSGQANTGTLAGATWTPNGRFGSGLDFNGIDAWVTVADAASLDLQSGITIEAWVNPASGAGTRTIVLKEAPGGLSYALYSAVSGQRPVGYVHTKRDNSVTGPSSIPMNTWTHVAFTYDGSTLRLYVNGSLVRSNGISGGGSPLMMTSGGALRIGGNAVFGEYFRGTIDEVRIYDHALSPADIQADMVTPIQ